jgi:hypothetical protein
VSPADRKIERIEIASLTFCVSVQCSANKDAHPGLSQTTLGSCPTEAIGQQISPEPAI